MEIRAFELKGGEDENCMELNLELYIHLRSLGYHPDVNIGTKEGRGHLWLELNGLIFDTTDPKYYGKKASDLKGVYIISEMESEKK